MHAGCVCVVAFARTILPVPGRVLTRTRWLPRQGSIAGISLTPLEDAANFTLGGFQLLCCIIVFILHVMQDGTSRQHRCWKLATGLEYQEVLDLVSDSYLWRLRWCAATPPGSLCRCVDGLPTPPDFHVRTFLAHCSALGTDSPCNHKPHAIHMQSPIMLSSINA